MGSQRKAEGRKKDAENGSKSNASEVRTVVRVSALDRQQRQQELAQLAGGQGASNGNGSSTDAAAYAFAESLLVQAASLRDSNLPPAPAKGRSRKSRAEKQP